jgi:hypothetical protein
MKTYIIQFLSEGIWQNYIAKDNTSVEFIQVSHAQQVIADLKPHWSMDDWRIVDSTGRVH